MNSLEPLLVLTLALGEAKRDIAAGRCGTEIRQARAMHVGIARGIALMAEHTDSPIPADKVESAVQQINLAAVARASYLEGMHRNLLKVTA